MSGSASPTLAEECAQQVTAFLAPHPGGELDAVIQPRLAHQVVQGSGGTSFGIHRADDDALQTGQNDRTGAHRARLERDGERAAGEVPATGDASSRAQGEDLRMRGGVLVGFPTVAGLSQKLPAGPEHDRADRHVSGVPVGGGARLLEGEAHHRLVVHASSVAAASQALIVVTVSRDEGLVLR